MSIANSIRHAVTMSKLGKLQDHTTVEHKVLNAFMHRGEFFTTTAHALYFALFVAEELDFGGAE